MILLVAIALLLAAVWLIHFVDAEERRLREAEQRNDLREALWTAGERRRR